MKNSKSRLVLGWLCISLLGSSSTALALSSNDFEICDRAAEVVAKQSNVPVKVLKAISRTETGRVTNNKLSPWPWTVNMEGKGVWFESGDAARAYAYKHYKRGARSFDVGCFQLNYRWHHHAFSSIEDMFSPIPNATYAANFLSQLYAELGSWEDAVGAYHSRTPKHAEKYKKIYAKHLAEVETLQSPLVQNSQSDKQKSSNGYKLLQSTGRVISAGSLMRENTVTGMSLFRPAQPLFGPRS